MSSGSTPTSLQVTTYYCIKVAPACKGVCTSLLFPEYISGCGSNAEEELQHGITVDSMEYELCWFAYHRMRASFIDSKECNLSM